MGDSIVSRNNKAKMLFTNMLTGFSCIMNHKAAPVTAITKVGLSACRTKNYNKQYQCQIGQSKCWMQLILFFNKGSPNKVPATAIIGRSIE